VRFAIRLLLAACTIAALGHTYQRTVSARAPQTPAGCALPVP